MMRVLRIAAAAAMVFALFAPLTHSAPSQRSTPASATGPRVIRTEPAYGEKAVDPRVNVLKVTFSEPMQAEHYSFTEIPPRLLPQWGKPVSLSEDGRTFTVPITLRPNQKYGIWINAPGHARFRSVDGKPAQPYQLFFNTGPMPQEAAERTTTTAASPARAEGTTPAPPSANNEFRILTPPDGSEVRERVKIVLPASAVPQNGSVILFIDGRFIIGMAPTRDDETLEYTWNTKDPLPGKESEEKRRPQDGPHTIRAHLVDPSGRVVQVAESKVTLRNLLSQPEIASDGVLLRYQFPQDLDYRNRFVADVLVPGSQKRHHEGEIRSSILFEDQLEEGPFILVAKFGMAEVNAYKLHGETLALRWGMPRSGRFEMAPVGTIRPMGRRSRLLPELILQFLGLPANKVKIGATWEAPIVVPEVLKDRAAFVLAQHTFEGLEWHGGQECARITTVYKAAVKDPEPSKWSVLATGAIVYPKGSTIEVKGQRTTLFAYRIGRVMRMVEHKDIAITLTQPVTPVGGATGMEAGMVAPGMPPAAGPVGPEMMEPGAEAPPGAFPGGMPGGFPGGMPRGMPGAQPGVRQRVVYTIRGAREVIDFLSEESTE